MLSEALNLICNKKDFIVMKVWNIYDTSVLYSSKNTRCGSAIYFPASSFVLQDVALLYGGAF